MKRLILVRHAKSSWNEPGLSDFERPLNKRGKENAPEMGKRLRERGVEPALILSSAAQRARLTAETIAKELSYPLEEIIFDQDLYLASCHELLSTVKRCNDNDDLVMIFAHNPGITEFCNFLSAAGIDNLPTTGIADIEFPFDRWRDVGRGQGRLLKFDFPKNRP